MRLEVKECGHTPPPCVVLVNEEWLEGHCAGGVGIFPRCFVYRENFADTVISQL